MQAPKHRSPIIVYTLSNSTLEQATDKFDTVLESLQIGDEDPTMKNRNKCIHRGQNLAWTLCSSTLEEAIEKFDTLLESLQIRDEDPTIKI